MLKVKMNRQDVPGEKGDVVWGSECKWLDLVIDEAKLFSVVEILKKCRIDIVRIDGISLDCGICQGTDHQGICQSTSCQSPVRDPKYVAEGHGAQLEVVKSY